MIIHQSIKVKGKVQGVGFRYYTENEALKLGITGHVCNQSDGSVLIVASANEQKMEQFIQSIRQGPQKSVVEVLEITVIPEIKFDTFEILR